MPNICSMSNPTPISWQDVEDASAKDKVALALNKLILFKDRAVLPASLHKEALEVLLSAHTKESPAWSAGQHHCG